MHPRGQAEYDAPRRPKVALGGAVIALKPNVAVAQKARIDFNPEWFNPKSGAVPAGRAPKKAEDATA